MDPELEVCRFQNYRKMESVRLRPSMYFNETQFAKPHTSHVFNIILPVLSGRIFEERIVYSSVQILLFCLAMSSSHSLIPMLKALSGFGTGFGRTEVRPLGSDLSFLLMCVLGGTALII